MTAEQIQKYSADMDELACESISWTRPGEWILELSKELPPARLAMTKEEKRFWPTFEWNENPWMVDKEGHMLAAKKFARIQACTIAQLHITRTADKEYTFTIPAVGSKQHQQAKLRRWGVAILLNSPAMKLGERLQTTTELRLRHPMHLDNKYTWEAKGAGRATGTTEEQRRGTRHTIEVVQQPNGIHWHVRDGDTTDQHTVADKKRMQRYQQEGSIMFYAHPHLHGFPWRVSDSIANKHVLKVIKQQPFDRYKRSEQQNQKLLDGLQEKAATSSWQRAVMAQTPNQLWEHRNELTEYQVWVAYRVAVRQLNLYFDGREQDNACRKLEECRGHKETLEHILWECPCARACWVKLIQHWTGEQWAEDNIHHFQTSCASRKAPSMSAGMARRIKEHTPDDEKEMVTEWTRMWRILASVCITSLWIQRNRVVFHQEEMTADRSVQEFWATRLRQLRALSKRERRSSDRQIQGARLHLCQQELERTPREQSPQVRSPEQPPDHDKAPALLSRLRTYQTSSHR
jgi:hypothetical protein